MKSLLFFLIRIYQKAISPMFVDSCRFYPSCSRYMIEAIEKRGIFFGILFGIKRILKCNPFFDGGYDPVPLKNKNELKKNG